MVRGSDDSDIEDKKRRFHLSSSLSNNHGKLTKPVQRQFSSHGPSGTSKDVFYSSDVCVDSGLSTLDRWKSEEHTKPAFIAPDSDDESVTHNVNDSHGADSDDELAIDTSMVSGDNGNVFLDAHANAYDYPITERSMDQRLKSDSDYASDYPITERSMDQRLESDSDCAGEPHFDMPPLEMSKSFKYAFANETKSTEALTECENFVVQSDLLLSELRRTMVPNDIHGNAQKMLGETKFRSEMEFNSSSSIFQRSRYGFSNSTVGLPFTDRFRLLYPGYLPIENGFVKLRNGTWYISCLTNIGTCLPMKTDETSYRSYHGIPYTEMVQWWHNYCDSDLDAKLSHPRKNCSTHWDPSFYSKSKEERNLDHSIGHTKFVSTSKFVHHPNYPSQVCYVYVNPRRYFDYSKFNQSGIESCIMMKMKVRANPRDKKLVTVGYYVQMVRSANQTNEPIVGGRDTYELRTKIWFKPLGMFNFGMGNNSLLSYIPVVSSLMDMFSGSVSPSSSNSPQNFIPVLSSSSFVQTTAVPKHIDVNSMGYLLYKNAYEEDQCLLSFLPMLFFEKHSEENLKTDFEDAPSTAKRKSLPHNQSLGYNWAGYEYSDDASIESSSVRSGSFQSELYT